MRRFFFCMAVVVSSVQPAFASSSSGGRITNVLVTSNGTVLFYMNGSRTGTIPACATGFPTRWAFNGATAAGQAKLANLLTAQSLRAVVTVSGTETCVSWSDTEEVNNLSNAGP